MKAGGGGPGQRRLLSARETATALGVKPATLYAYVSRGLLPREHRPGHRGSWFDPAAVDRLASRGRAATGQSRRGLRLGAPGTPVAPPGPAHPRAPPGAPAPPPRLEPRPGLLRHRTP